MNRNRSRFQRPFIFRFKGREYQSIKVLDFGVYLVKELSTNRLLALQKILFRNNEELIHIKGQIELWSRLNNSEYIVKLIDHQIFGSCFIELLFEPSPHGTLKTFLEKRSIPLTEKEILLFVEDIAKGIDHLHSQSSPIIHSNIKIDSILVFQKNLRISGMGSCYLQPFDHIYQDKVSKKEIYSILERKYQLINRTPEMFESDENSFKITKKIDIWMLGCVLYNLIYKTHPFLNADRDAIINAQYNTPKTNYSEKLLILLELLLWPDPELRPNSKKVLEIIKDWNNTNKIDLPV